MRVLSVQVGKPKSYNYEGRKVRTAIFKRSVEGRREVRDHQIEGDKQGDPRVHGGEYKAVYAYPFERYASWSERHPELDLPNGAFGENLTTEGVLEGEVLSGDRYRIGTVELVASTPRMPCFKLNIRHARPDMLALFLEYGYPGVYFSVAREGELGPGDSIELIERGTSGMDMISLFWMYLNKCEDRTLYERGSQLQTIPPGWRQRFARAALDPRF